MTTLDVHPSSAAIRTTLLGIGVSVVLIVIKATSGYLGHSYALIADATESGADVVSSGLLWLGLRIALKEPDEEHPYGHGKAEPLAAIVAARWRYRLAPAAEWPVRPWQGLAILGKRGMGSGEEGSGRWRARTCRKSNS